MVCPFAGLLGVGVVASGSQRLLVKDRRYRSYSWAAAVLLGLSWVAYFVAARRHEVRVALEVVSVLGLVAAAFRVRALVRSGEVAPLSAGALGRTLDGFGYAVRSPWVAGAKAWLLAMIVFQWFGRATFSGVEYGAVVVVLLGLVVTRLVRRPAPARFGSLERFGSEPALASCPLGFGCAPGPRAAASNDAPRPGTGPSSGPRGSASRLEGWEA